MEQKDQEREKAYRNELNGKGSAFTDSQTEAEGRDAAKMDKVAARQTQKMDGGNPFAEEDSVSDEEIRGETVEKK